MKLKTDLILEEHIGFFNIRHLRHIDIVLLAIVTIIAAIGLMTLYSADRSTDVSPPYYVKQAMFFGLSLFLALGIACVDFRALVSLAPIAFVVVILLLIGVEIWGKIINGAQRWLVMGPVRLQPSEQAKLALIFMLAWYFSRLGPKIRKLHWFVFTFFIAAIPGLLILKQPNLGTAAALGPITLAMLFMAGCRRWHFAALIVCGLAAIPVAWSQLEEYQRTRVNSFLRPGEDPMGTGYHTLQSMITVGSGGLTGKGYGDGTQTYLSYLPEHHTDFIFSLLAEEWGFMGATLLIALYGLMLLRGLSFAQNCPDTSGSLLAVGIVTLLSFHIFVNIAITVGLMPVTGIPLPFMSYGRSFYLTTMLCVGVLFSVRTRRETVPKSTPTQTHTFSTGTQSLLRKNPV